MSKKQNQIVRLPIPVENADERHGLTFQQVQQRQDGGWANVAGQGVGKSEREIVLSNIFTFFNLVFISLAILLMVAGSSILNMGFMIIVVVNTVIGIYQEIRAKRAVDKLTLVAEGTVRAIRDGKTLDVPVHDLVRDDIVEFRAGDQICADGVVRSGNLQVNESLITGEADAIIKEAGDELMSGSFVITGKARVQLTNVGPDSFAAKLAAEAKANPSAKRSGMQRSLDGLIRAVGFLLVPVGIAMFYQHYVNLQMGLRDSAEGTVAALIGMIMDEFVIDNAEDNGYVSAEAKALFDELSKNIFVPSYTDGILEKGFGAFYLLWDVRNGGDINQTLAQYETAYQKMIDDANIMLRG